MKPTLTIKNALSKIEHFCTYQERCHHEVLSKLKSMQMTTAEIDEIMVQLIASNFVNETRFACSFVRGKHRIKHWGRIRIVNELKMRHISTYTINLALKEIIPEDYEAIFEKLAIRYWETSTEKNTLKKRKKFCDYLLRLGYESNLVYDKMQNLEKNIQ